MNVQIIPDETLAPATVIWNKLTMDPDRPPRSQLYEFYDELLFAEFPNGVGLGVEWFPDAGPAGEFRIWLSQNPDVYQPFAERSAASFESLKQAVYDLAEQASKRRECYPFSLKSLGADHVWLNDLWLDPALPPQVQPQLHKAELFEAFVGQYVIGIGWSAPGSPAGEFVVSLKYIPEQWQLPTENPFRVEHVYKPETWQPVREARCGSLADLERTVAEFTAKAKSPTGGAASPDAGKAGQ